MDKIQKIREEVVRMHNLLPVMDGDNISVNYADRICTTLEMYIDSLQEEHESEIILDGTNFNKSWYAHPELAFKAGANWKEQQMMSKAVDAKLLEGHLIRQKDVTHPLHIGDKVKVIVIKED